MPNLMKAGAAMLGLIFLLACGGPTQREDPGVQDIKPGEKSIIQPPEKSDPLPNRIQERNI